MAQQKVWFVTGASRGFGRVWTEAALSRGDKVVATARDPKTLEALQKTYGDSVLALQLDVTNREQVFETVQKGHQHFGRLDVILSNAGYGCVGALEEMDIQVARDNFETNLFGTISVIQAALPLLRKQGSGHILTLSSIGGVIAFPTGGIYVAGKWAIEGLSESLAGEVASFGIKVTIIEPGSFATEFRPSMASAPTMEDYDKVREAVYANFQPEMAGDPRATSEAVLKVVDAEKPPLRLILGKLPLTLIKQAYAARMGTWDEWSDVAVAAHGR